MTPSPVSFAILSLLSLLPTPTLSANNVIFVNHCPYPLHFWPVKGEQVHDWELTTVPSNGGSHILPMSVWEGGGISLKIRDVPHYEVAPAGIIQAEYNFEPTKNSIWYDLSTIDCVVSSGPTDPMYCPFIEGGVKMYVEGQDKCPIAACSNTQCTNTYRTHGFWLGEPSFVCDAGQDVILETCTEGHGLQTNVDGKGWTPSAPSLPPPFPPPPPPPSTPEPKPKPTPTPTPSVVSSPKPMPTGMPDEPYNLQIFPLPINSSMPHSTLCLDEDCLCYAVLEPYLWPVRYANNTPDCRHLPIKTAVGDLASVQSANGTIESRDKWMVLVWLLGDWVQEFMSRHPSNGTNETTV
ncbi:hypothetical protein BS50DRAFT_573610 [Corynespora cassiicola Philippines]|uniref:Osmotin, thaumatin-like protein n=1 Tax=Corynespora cassiicola Philippines TaxID=1448308 RepID=A0A2T2NN05_CORCC|nr:hypothetical protein BS50DRAFT_573610 [Corynespora cassiicola Philippines]